MFYATRLANDISHSKAVQVYFDGTYILFYLSVVVAEWRCLLILAFILVVCSIGQWFLHSNVCTCARFLCVYVCVCVCVCVLFLF
jgi:hypothetical protein